MPPNERQYKVLKRESEIGTLQEYRPPLPTPIRDHEVALPRAFSFW